MLTKLQIRNYAIIKEVDIFFDNKLNIITGETGAGKSILMGALGLILGERADSKVLMQDDEKCVVEGHFNIESYELLPFFEEEGLDYDPLCIVRREITANGKSRAFINDTPVTLNQLKGLGSQLIDIVSQHQTMELNEEKFQLGIIDAIAETGTEKASYQDTYREFKQTEKSLKELLERETKARQDEDYFRFILNELTEAAISADEQDLLEKEIDALSNAESIQQAAFAAFNALDGGEQNLIDQLREIKAALL